MRRYLHRDEGEMETLRPGTPSDAGLKEDYVSKALSVLEDGLRGGVYPGFTVLVARKGVVAIHRADGYAQLIPERRPMGLNTVFDLASLTKPVCTATLTLKMVEKGVLALETRVCEVLDGWDEGWRSKVTIRHLLTHTSGLPAWIPLYRKCRGKAEYLRAINRVEKAYEPGSKTVYSDLGVMVLGFILEEVSSSTLDTLSRREIFKPLGMTETCFNPSGEVKARAAATEKCPWRGRVVVGEVHDENAYALGVVAGHAGLFSTVRAGHVYHSVRVSDSRFLGLCQPSVPACRFKGCNASECLEPGNSDVEEGTLGHGSPSAQVESGNAPEKNATKN